MKKIYMTPEMETVDLKTNSSILTGSKIPTNNGNPSEWGAPGYDFDEDEEDW